MKLPWTLAVKFENNMKIKYKELSRRYKENEDSNFHTENIVLLTSFFGTREDYAIAKGFKQIHQTLGELPKNQELRDIVNEIQKRVYQEYLKAGKFEMDVFKLHN